MRTQLLEISIVGRITPRAPPLSFQKKQFHGALQFNQSRSCERQFAPYRSPLFKVRRLTSAAT